MKLKWILVMSLMLSITSLAKARTGSGGTEGGNGGDICEDQLKTVRDEIGAWLKAGGGVGLNLPQGLTLASYRTRMLKAISSARVGCTDDEVTVQGESKMCENFTQLGHEQVLCNRKDFLMNKVTDQILLVHHEYAGLAGFEDNGADGSQYEISNQLVHFLNGNQLVVDPNAGTDPGKINITILPTAPVVVTADFLEIDPFHSTPGAPVYKTITAPWIKFSYGITNANDPGLDPGAASLTVVEIDLDISGTTPSGVAVSSVSKFSASDAAGYDPATSPPYLAEVLPGQFISPGNNSSGVFDGTNYTGDFYAMSLPSLMDSGQTPGSPLSYQYTVKATFTGWFGTYDHPQKRFTRVITFITQ